jgi:hypothetical protein
MMDRYEFKKSHIDLFFRRYKKNSHAVSLQVQYSCNHTKKVSKVFLPLGTLKYPSNDYVTNSFIISAISHNLSSMSESYGH